MASEAMANSDLKSFFPPFCCLDEALYIWFVFSWWEVQEVIGCEFTRCSNNLLNFHIDYIYILYQEQIKHISESLYDHQKNTDTLVQPGESNFPNKLDSWEYSALLFYVQFNSNRNH